MFSLVLSEWFSIVWVAQDQKDSDEAVQIKGEQDLLKEDTNLDDGDYDEDIVNPEQELKRANNILALICKLIVLLFSFL